MEHINLSNEYASTIEDMESVLAGNAHMYELYEVRHKSDGSTYKYHYQSMFVEDGVDVDEIIKERVAVLVSIHNIDASKIMVSRVDEDRVSEKLNKIRLWLGQ